MIHKMRLHDEPFRLIKDGTKDVELRVNDEKRKLIKINDVIEFENRLTSEKIAVVVEKLDVYPNFFELYKHYNKVEMGYKEDEEASSDDMLEYYSKEEQERYGVVAITIKLKNK